MIRTLRTRAERAEAALRELGKHPESCGDDCVSELARQDALAELAAARKDAERYRWLRDKYTVSLLNGEHELRITHGPRANSTSGIDDVIDAARGDTRRGRAPPLFQGHEDEVER